MLRQMLTLAFIAPVALSLPTGMMGSDKCTALTHPDLLATEDFEHIGGGKFLIPSGDITAALFEGSWDAEAGPRSKFAVSVGVPPREGGFFLVDVNTKPPTLSSVPMNGFPKEIFFLAHGSYYSNATQQYYVVNHGFAQGGDSVSIFKVHQDPISVEYVRSVTSDLFGNGQLNDVIEGRNGNELFVTQWTQNPLPLSGPSLEDGGNAVLSDVKNWSPTGGKIFSCVWEDSADAQCQIAFAGGHAPNGITKKVTDAGAEVFVADPFVDIIRTFKFSNGQNSGRPDGHLVEVGRVTTPYGCDNLFYDAEGDFINCGANLDLAAALSLFGSAYKANLANRHPGTNMKMVPPGDNGAWVLYPHHAMHDGTQQKMCSTAISYGSITVFGSPPSTGLILVCDSASAAETPKEEL